MLCFAEHFFREENTLNIIEKIEINYFRSIYNETINNTNSLNIFTGKNDSGKSNILKAINLFFNNETGHNEPFDFYEDFSKIRAREVREQKGRGTIWIKITFNNFLGWKSLPKKFHIKKTWNRYDPTPTIEYPKEITQTVIARFSNKISYSYVPAIKSSDIFEYYLGALHDTLLDDEKTGLRDASKKLIKTINNTTEEMRTEIKRSLGIESTIQIPEDLSNLFRSLDFSTIHYNNDIPLKKRGDGIQGRHIPIILNHIGSRSGSHNIWGYEEPENSLELGKAFELAEQFAAEFSLKNQIFLTTHSPAFYDTQTSNSKRWLVKPEARDSNIETYTTTINQITDSELTDEEIGFAALLSERARAIYNELSTEKRVSEELNKKIKEMEKPNIFVEGITDKRILETAYAKLYPDQTIPYEIISADGVDKLGTFAKARMHISQRAKQEICLFDNDYAGRKALKESCKVKDPLDDIHYSSNLMALCLTVPDELSDIWPEEKLNGLPLTIEYMFPRELIENAINDKILELNEIITINTHKGIQSTVNTTFDIKSFLPEEYFYLAYSVSDSSKTRFSEWLKNKPPSHFANLLVLFEEIDSFILESDNLEYEAR